MASEKLADVHTGSGGMVTREIPRRNYYIRSFFSLGIMVAIHDDQHYHGNKYQASFYVTLRASTGSTVYPLV